MEDKVKKTTGKAAVRHSDVSEVPEQVKAEVKEPKVTEKRQPKEPTAGKVSTIKVDTKGQEVERFVVGSNDLIKDFWNHKPTTKREPDSNVTLHLVEYRGQYRWLSARQIEITVRKTKEVIVDNRPPRNQMDYLSFPKFTEITVEAGGKCKGCQ